MKEYVPKAFRDSNVETRKEMWGIGVENFPGEFGMIAGPFPTEQMALDTPGRFRARIIHFYSDGRDEVVWYWRKDRWVRKK